MDVAIFLDFNKTLFELWNNIFRAVVVGLTVYVINC